MTLPRAAQLHSFPDPLFMLHIADRINRIKSSPSSMAGQRVRELKAMGRDIVGQSQTGSGKTAAFAIPAIERMDVTDRSVQALILCPTRELAVQVSEEVHKLAHFKPGIRPLPIYGGQSYDRQFAGLRAGANIVIGTPGRVMDHMNRKTLKLDRIRMDQVLFDGLRMGIFRGGVAYTFYPGSRLIRQDAVPLS